MDQYSFSDFLTALGEEFATALSLPVDFDLIVPQDGYDVWRRTFGTDPTPAALAALAAPDIERLRAECARYFECRDVSADQVRLAIDRVLSRWPE